MNPEIAPQLFRFELDSGSSPYDFDQVLPKGTKISHRGGDTTLPVAAKLVLMSPGDKGGIRIELEEVPQG